LEIRLDDYRLPKKKNEREQLARQIGLDGHYLLDQVWRLKIFWLFKQLLESEEQPLSILTKYSVKSPNLLLAHPYCEKS